jgi:uncharacterized protein (TIGR02391 family)
VAVFDYIRHRTKLNTDGAALIDAVLAPSNPHLILSDLNSESGQNDQKGFMQIYKGAFQGIRNPSAISILGSAAIAAAFIPARRASGVDPTDALRVE